MILYKCQENKCGLLLIRLGKTANLKLRNATSLRCSRFLFFLKEER